LFTRRLALLAALDGHDIPASPIRDAERTLRRETADLLHRIVAAMNENNFAVRPHRQLVLRYLERSAWDDLDGERIAEIGERLAGSPSAERDDDEDAKRFDLLILRAQLCVLDHEPGFASIAEQVREIASALLEQTSIPVIREQEVFLDAGVPPHHPYRVQPRRSRAGQCRPRGASRTERPRLGED
jgi:type I restriction enzyme, R subunit